MCIDDLVGNTDIRPYNHSSYPWVYLDIVDKSRKPPSNGTIVMTAMFHVWKWRATVINTPAHQYSSRDDRISPSNILFCSSAARASPWCIGERFRSQRLLKGLGVFRQSRLTTWHSLIVDQNILISLDSAGGRGTDSLSHENLKMPQQV